MTFTAPPYLTDPDPDATPATVPVTFRTRYGTEVHHHRDGDVHTAGPTCQCKPEIEWRPTDARA